MSFKKLLEHVAIGGTDPDVLSSLASRLARLDKQCGPERAEARSRRPPAASAVAEHRPASIVDALDPDRQVERGPASWPASGRGRRPTAEQLEQAAEARSSRRPREPLADEAARCRNAARRTSSASSSRSSTRSRRTSCSTRALRRGGRREGRSAGPVVRARSSPSTRTRSTPSSSSTAGPTRSAPAVRRHQGAGGDDQGAAARRGRPSGSGAPTRCSRGTRCAAPPPAAAHRHRLARPVRAAPGRASSSRSPSRCRAVRALDGAAGEPRPAASPREQVRWLEMIRDHIADEPRDRRRRLRLRALRGGGRAGEGLAGVRGGAAAVAG